MATHPSTADVFRTRSTPPAEAPIAILSALHEELRALLPLLDERRTETLAGRQFHRGRLHGRPVVLALSGIGKVACAATAALLLQHFAARRVLFTAWRGRWARA